MTQRERQFDPEILEIADYVDRYMEKTRYGNLIRNCTEDHSKRGNFSLTEKYMDDFLIDLVKKSKYTALGPEPLLGYFVGKENEILNLRIILTGKMNNLSGSVIRERLRQSYV